MGSATSGSRKTEASLKTDGWPAGATATCVRQHESARRPRRVPARRPRARQLPDLGAERAQRGAVVDRRARRLGARQPRDRGRRRTADHRSATRSTRISLTRAAAGLRSVLRRARPHAVPGRSRSLDFLAAGLPGNGKSLEAAFRRMQSAAAVGIAIRNLEDRYWGASQTGGLYRLPR